MEEKSKDKGYILRKLFFACLYLSTFTFGGGYVIVTLLKEKFVDHYHWIDEEESGSHRTVFARSHCGEWSDRSWVQACRHTRSASLNSGGHYTAYGDFILNFGIL